MDEKQRQEFIAAWNAGWVGPREISCLEAKCCKVKCWYKPWTWFSRKWELTASYGVNNEST